MIKFSKISAKNFLSFKSMELDIPETGLFFIKGKTDDKSSNSNGAGKSAIWEALCWCLYGKTIRGVAADDVIRVGKKQGEVCEVSVFFKVDNDFVVVRRSRTPKTLTVTVNKIDVSSPQMNTTQEQIELLLGMTFGVFTNSVIFGQGLPFRFTQATDAERKVVLDKILQFEWLVKARENAKEKANILLRDIIPEFKSTIIIEDTAIANKNIDIAVVEVDLKAKETQLIDKQAVKKSVSEAKVKITDITADIVCLQEDSMLFAAKWKDIDIAVDKLNKTNVSERYELTTIKTTITNKTKLINELTVRLKSFNNMSRSGWCPTCEQKVPKEHSGVIKERLTEDLAELLDEVGVCERECSTKDNSFSVRKNEIEGKLREREDFINELNRVRGEVAEFEKTRKTFEDFVFENAGGGAVVEYFEKEIKVLKTRLKCLKDDVFKRAKIVKETKNNLAEAERQLELHNFWVEGFGNKGIKSMVLGGIMPLLNESAESYAEYLTGGELFVEFKATSETKTGVVQDKLDVTVKKKNLGQRYASCSGGEKRRADVVVLLALYDLIGRKSNTQVNILVFDEVFEALDSSGVENLVGLLKQFSDTKAVYVIAHRDDVDDFFDNSITVTKEKGVSRIGSE